MRFFVFSIRIVLFQLYNNDSLLFVRGNDLQCVSSQCIEKDYDKMALPDLEKATEVHTSFELRDVIDIDDDKFSITFSKFEYLY